MILAIEGLDENKRTEMRPSKASELEVAVIKRRGDQGMNKTVCQESREEGFSLWKGEK